MILLLHNFTNIYYFLLFNYSVNIVLGNSIEARVSKFVESKGHIPIFIYFITWVSKFRANPKILSQSYRLTLSF